MPANALVIYKSSAGSGKTYTLVLEYLKLVLKRPGLYRSILAITFTNKATEEMKTRIIGSLVELSQNKNPQLQEVLSNETGLAVSELPGKATLVLDNILHDYSGFGVSTIDSFFSTIVRALARELNLPLRFDIELNIDAVIGEISTMMLDDIGTNPWLKKWLEEFIFDKLDQGKSWKIESDIHNLSYELFKESYRTLFPKGPAKPDASFIKELREIVSGFENRMAEYGNTFLAIIARNDLSIADFAFGKSGVANYFSKITKKLKARDYIPGSRFEGALTNPDAWATKSSARRSEIISLAGSQLIHIANDVNNFRISEIPRYSGAKIVLNTIHIAGIFSLLDEKLTLFRDENDIVLISDTNQLLQKAINNEDAPFIYEKTGNRFTHFMLDEFQDTSDYQWQNLAPLIENALAAGNYAMIVGDAKQSIYRWRGGNMQLLLSGVQKNLIHYAEITELKHLGENYRSREQIVNFNNDFFEIAPSLLLPDDESKTLRIAYHSDELRQKWKKGKDAEGYINIRVVDVKNNGTPSIITENDTEHTAATWTECALQENLAIVKKVLELGYEYRDIAFLTRSNKDARCITEFLIQNNIHRIISPESMLLNASPAVQFLVNLLHLVDDYQDDIVLAQVVYYWNHIKKGDTKLSLHYLFAASRKIKLDLLPEAFTKKFLEFRKIPLFEAVEELSIIFNLGSPPEAYIQRFFDVVLDYTKKNPANITDFLIWWNDNQEKDTCSVIIPSGENAIRVMSIHKSKGLQFPVVIIPFADWELTPMSQSIHWMKSNIPPFDRTPAHPVKFSPDLELSVFKEDYEKEMLLNYVDNLNLLYVAFTRAEEQLYVISKKPSAAKNKENVLPCRAGELIEATLLSHPEFSAMYTAAEGSFEKGLCSGPLRSSPQGKQEGKNLEQWFSTSWKPRIKMGISKKKISIDDSETPETQYGILFHSLLSEIQTLINPETFVKTNEISKSLESSIQHRLIDEIKMFVDAALGYGWFDTGSVTVNEAELLLPDGSLLRPDRLILSGDKVVVIDYKTGAEESYHAEQVQQYASVLEKMGYKETKLFLVYAASGKVMEIPFYQ